MSEWTHSQSTDADEPAPKTVADYQNMAANLAPPPEKRRRKLGLYVAGSLGVVLVGGILFQVFRAEPGAAGPDEDAERQRTAARLSPGTVLARVDGHNISWQEVAEECMVRYGKEVLDNLVNRTIIQQACAKRDIEVTNAEVSREVARIASKFKLTPENWYQMLQAERGISKTQYQRDIIWPMLALKKIAGSNISVTNEEMQKKFEREYGERAQVRLIMLDNSRRATDVHAMCLQNPENFDRIAQEHSVEPNSKHFGGEIPPIPRHSGNPVIEKEAFRLRKGEISSVKQIGKDRWIILKCEGRTTPHIKERTKAVDQELYNMLIEEKTQEAVAQVFQKLRRESEVYNYLTGQTTGIQRTSGKDEGSAKIRSPYVHPSPQEKQTPSIR